MRVRRHVGCPSTATALAVLLLLLGPASCVPLQYNLRLVKVGLVAPLSGPAKAEGERWTFAARDAVQEWNLSTGSGPYRVELITYDEAEGPVVARRLAVDPEVLGVVGYLRSENLDGALSAFQEVGMPLATLAMTGPRLPQQRAPAVRLLPTQETLERLAATLHPVSTIPQPAPRVLAEVSSWWPVPVVVVGDRDRALWLSPTGGAAGSPEAARFVLGYQERWSTPPSPLAVAAYDGLNAILRGMDAAFHARPAERRARIGAALTQPYEGLAGEYRWDPWGEPETPHAYLLDVTDGFPGRIVRQVP